MDDVTLESTLVKDFEKRRKIFLKKNGRNVVFYPLLFINRQQTPRHFIMQQKIGFFFFQTSEIEPVNMCK